MNFLVDAQLPRRLAVLFNSLGQSAIHTLDLPTQNRTTDQQIKRISSDEGRVVVSKDRDFVNSFWLENRPEKLLLVSTGNIGNDELLQLFAANLARLVDAFKGNRFIELSREGIIIHA